MSCNRATKGMDIMPNADTPAVYVESESVGEAMEMHVGGSGAVAPSAAAPSPLMRSSADGMAMGDSAGSGGGGVPSSRTPDRTGGPSVEPSAPAQDLAATLTAGVWDDSKNWDFWQGLFTRANAQDGNDGSEWDGLSKTWWNTRATLRHTLRVEGPSGPIRDAHVSLLDATGTMIWYARSDARGNADLYEGFFGEGPAGSKLVVTAGGERRELDARAPNQSERQVVRFERAPDAPKTVDVMFTIDTTGSMADELRYIQTDIANVITNAHRELGQNYTIRTSVNFYRDNGDEYVVRAFPFTTNLSEVQSQINQQTADGGGDHPEAVDKALDASIAQHEWTDHAAARVLFLVLDAEPHGGDDVRQSLERSVRNAAAKGIRIIPVMGSGYTRSTEYLMRNYALATGGVFAFLTDHSGVGNPHLEPTVGSYRVEKLNDLLSRLIVAYVNGDY